MATKNEIYQTIIWSLTFYGILAVFLVLSRSFLTGLETSFNPIFVVLALVPFVFFLVVTDQLRGLRGAGIEITLQESSQRAVSRDIIRESILPVPVGSIGVKGGIEWDRPEKPPTTLSYTLGYYYGDWPDDSYFEHLEEHPQLRYVLFESEGFEGYMHVKDYENLLEYDIQTFIEEIQTTDILSRNSVNTESIRLDTSKKEALELMNEENINELAVVGLDDEFIGVVNQDDIVRRILTSMIQE